MTDIEQPTTAELAESLETPYSALSRAKEAETKILSFLRPVSIASILDELGWTIEYELDMLVEIAKNAKDDKVRMAAGDKIRKIVEKSISVGGGIVSEQVHAVRDVNGTPVEYSAKHLKLASEADTEVMKMLSLKGGPTRVIGDDQNAECNAILERGRSGPDEKRTDSGSKGRPAGGEGVCGDDGEAEEAEPADLCSSERTESGGRGSTPDEVEGQSPTSGKLGEPGESEQDDEIRHIFGRLREVGSVGSGDSETEEGARHPGSLPVTVVESFDPNSSFLEAEEEQPHQAGDSGGALGSLARNPNRRRKPE